MSSAVSCLSFTAVLVAHSASTVLCNWITFPLTKFAQLHAFRYVAVGGRRRVATGFRAVRRWDVYWWRLIKFASVLSNSWISLHHHARGWLDWMPISYEVLTEDSCWYCRMTQAFWRSVCNSLNNHSASCDGIKNIISLMSDSRKPGRYLSFITCISNIQYRLKRTYSISAARCQQHRSHRTCPWTVYRSAIAAGKSFNGRLWWQ